MRLPFHLIIEFAHKRSALVEKASQEFFAETGFPGEEQKDDAFPLFSEWLIYDYRQPSGQSFLEEYTSSDPDGLISELLSHFRQVAKTYWYGAFEILRVKKGEWVELERLFSGRKVKVYDYKSTKGGLGEGTLVGRIGKVNRKWYFVGSNPIFLPQIYTKRLKRLLKAEEIVLHPTPKETWQLLSNRELPGPQEVSMEEIKDKQQRLEKEFHSLARKEKIPFSFEDLLFKVYGEDGQSPAKFWEALLEEGLNVEVFNDHLDLFQDIWNYFPHRILKGKSPVGRYRELRRLADES